MDFFLSILQLSKYFHNPNFLKSIKRTILVKASVEIKDYDYTNISFIETLDF